MAASHQRDMEFVRNLLLQIEEGRKVFDTRGAEMAARMGDDPASYLPQVEADKLLYHLRLLEDAGFIGVSFKALGGAWSVDRLTWNGHEFLDTIRDPEVWKLTKSGAEKAGNASVSFIWELAKAYGKQLASEKLGIALA
jgi:hypothetical protein